MSSSPSNTQELWEQCIKAVMLLRRHCHKRPSVYFTESGSLVLDARPVNPVDRDIVNAIFVTCDLIANDYGFYQDVSNSVADLYVWKKGGEV